MTARTNCRRQGVEQSGAEVAAHGPIPQAHFLAGLGIEARLDSLTAAASPSQQESLISGFNRLTGGRETPDKSIQMPSPEDLGPGLPTSAVKSEDKIAATSEQTAEKTVQGQPAGKEVGRSSRDSSLEKRFKDAPRPPSALDNEGMGFSYKVFAITSSKSAPVPFPGSGVEFED